LSEFFAEALARTTCTILNSFSKKMKSRHCSSISVSSLSNGSEKNGIVFRRSMGKAGNVLLAQNDMNALPTIKFETDSTKNRTTEYYITFCDGERTWAVQKNYQELLELVESLNEDGYDLPISAFPQNPVGSCLGVCLGTAESQAKLGNRIELLEDFFLEMIGMEKTWKARRVQNFFCSPSALIKENFLTKEQDLASFRSSANFSHIDEFDDSLHYRPEVDSSGYPVDFSWQAILARRKLQGRQNLSGPNRLRMGTEGDTLDSPRSRDVSTSRPKSIPMPRALSEVHAGGENDFGEQHSCRLSTIIENNHNKQAHSCKPPTFFSLKDDDEGESTKNDQQTQEISMKYFPRTDLIPHRKLSVKNDKSRDCYERRKLLINLAKEENSLLGTLNFIEIHDRDSYTVTFAKGPLGLNIAKDDQTNAPIVLGFLRGINDKMQQAEELNFIEPSDYIFAVCGQTTVGLQYQQVMKMIFESFLGKTRFSTSDPTLTFMRTEAFIQTYHSYATIDQNK